MKAPEPIPFLIPAPTRWLPAGGEFALSDLQRIRVTGDDDLSALAFRSAARLEPVLGRTLPVQAEDAVDASGGSLHFKQVTGLASEQYEMRITGAGIEIAATEPAGFHHATTSLIQLVLNRRADGQPPTVPRGEIHDRPRFGWRGLLLDCGRHFMSVEIIKALLDKLAMHKFNVLHWHLTEDQGWRLEVPGYPRLTKIGAWRTEIDGSTHGGFYTADDVREIVNYAAERFISVVPEIEMPGHSLAALAAYPEFSCTGGPFNVQTQWGIHEDVLCPGREETFGFLADVLTHVMDLFPGRYIHIGGDEVPVDRWRKCGHCQERIQGEGLADETALQGWFTARIAEFLAEKGRRLIGWDEITAGFASNRQVNPADVTVQAWRGLDEAAAAAEAGYDVIVSPTSHAYFDYDPGTLDLRQVHEFRPVPPNLSEAAADRILGGQMNLWTEYVPEARVDSMLFPRLTAMAEALWTGTQNKDFSSFLDRLHRHDPVLDHLGVESGVAARPVTVRGGLDSASGACRLTVTVDPGTAAALTGRDLVVRHSVLESPLPSTFQPDLLPEEQSLPAITPATDMAPEILAIPLAGRTGGSSLVQVQLFVDDRPYGAQALLEVEDHEAVGADLHLVHEPAKQYRGDQAGGLVNGLHGSRFFQDGMWTGFLRHDLDATLDLGSQRNLRRVSARFLQDVNERILLPLEVRFSVSAAKDSWLETPAVTHDVSDKVQDKVIHEFAFDLDGSAVRYVRVQGINPGLCPDWHPGRGEPCWLFADEIVCR